MLRSKHGRDKLFETPDLMWEAACEYFEWCFNTPLIETSPQVLRVNGEGDHVEMTELPKMRAFTMQGLCRYLDCNTAYFNQFEAELAKKYDDVSKDFSKVVTRIRETIFEQKFTGAAAGFLNSNIISMELGLKNKHETELTMPQGVNINFLKKDK